MGVITAAVLTCTAVLTVSLNFKNISAEEDEKNISDAAAMSQETEKYASNSWWKASLSDYNEALTLVSYEKVKIPKDKNSEKTEKAKNQPEGILVNDTGICYIEPHSDYQAIQILPDDSYTEQIPFELPQQNIQQSGPVSLEPGNFSFTTYGYGHGVGMSQNGANHYALYSGWNYQQILGHYYPGTYTQQDEITPESKITAGGVTGSVLDIVSMVTYNEVGGSMSDEAIKAQAVAAYTYIMYNGGDAPDLCPKPAPPQNVVDAVNSVLGEAVYYDGSYALTMFGASSGGSTASCYDIFYQDIPYLISVPCEYDDVCDPHYGTVEVISEDEVREQLESNLGIILSDDPSNWIAVTEGDGGYAAYVLIDGQVTIKGYELRNYLGLKSPKFQVEYY